MDKKVWKAYLSAIVYAIIIGLSFLFSKIALRSASPLDALTYRFSVPFLVLTIPILSKKLPVNLVWEPFKQLLPLALFYPLLFMGFQTFGLLTASLSEAGIIQAIAPILVMILARTFLGETLNSTQKISIFISVSGVLYILIKKGSTIDLANLKGIILLLCSVFSFAIYNILARKQVQHYSNWELSYTMLSVSFLIFTSLTLIKYAAQGNLLGILDPLKDPSFLISILYLGGLSTLGTSMLNNYALSQLEASRVSVFGNLGTIISILAGVIILQEELHYYHILGSVLIIIGVLGTNMFTDKLSKEEDLEFKQIR